MLIIAGNLYVTPEHRDGYVARFVDVVRRVRTGPG